MSKLFCFLSEKESTLKVKKGCKLFPFRADPVSEGDKSAKK